VRITAGKPTLSNVLENISMTIYYLMVKTHNITGLKYLCQTKHKDPHKYLGSGKDWLIHLMRHGKEHSTEIIIACQSRQELYYWGMYYSSLWRVVTGQDDFGNKIWANRIKENGGGEGMTSDLATEIQNRPATKLKNSDSHKMLWKNKEYIKKQIDAHQSIDYRTRNSVLQKEVQNRPEVKEKLSGKNSYKYDHTIYTFIHTTGIIETLTQYDLIRKYDLCQPNLNSVVRNKRRIHKGWMIA